MTLAAEYRQQSQWRSWNLLFEELPLQPGNTILDLGCGIGDQARELASRGCNVIGLDANQELIDAALRERPPNCEFLLCDLRKPPNLGLQAGGIWCSFAAAYFPRLDEFLSRWTPLLKPGGWLALTEIDDLFGHEPLSPRTRSLLREFEADALAAGRYDFHMGSKLQGCLEQAGLAISQSLTLPDQEFSFQGAAEPEVIEAWRQRFQRMPRLREICDSEFGPMQEEFLSCLARPDHISTAKVISCIATRIS
ncbi:MAG TPA: methyltransferase domain-containing protein [Acidobacteriaceae bacterium]|nr:methyltransferase domain-containing protein [Acidobacteriaceae bacterium]